MRINILRSTTSTLLLRSTAPASLPSPPSRVLHHYTSTHFSTFPPTIATRAHVRDARLVCSRVCVSVCESVRAACSVVCTFCCAFVQVNTPGYMCFFFLSRACQRLSGSNALVSLGFAATGSNLCECALRKGGFVVCGKCERRARRMKQLHPARPPEMCVENNSTEISEYVLFVRVCVSRARVNVACGVVGCFTRVTICFRP